MEVSMRQLAVLLPLLLAGCATTNRPPAQPSCADTHFAENPRIAAWSVDKFAGRYRNGADELHVTRQGEHRFVVQRPGYGTRELATENVESWKFHDGCGLIYEFVLPPDGPGAWLKITDTSGAVSNWTRS
jgi:hypothetical protein